MKEQLTNSFEFIENIDDQVPGITQEKLEKIAKTFDFSQEPEILKEMILLANNQDQTQESVSYQNFMSLMKTINLIN